MGQIVYCPKCDNVTSVKEKCKIIMLDTVIKDDY